MDRMRTSDWLAGSCANFAVSPEEIPDKFIITKSVTYSTCQFFASLVCLFINKIAVNR